MFSITNYQPKTKNTLRGMFDLSIADRLTIKGFTHHAKDSKQWVGVPSKPWTDKDGKQTWTPVVEFASNDARERFRKWAIGQIEAMQPPQPAPRTRSTPRYRERDSEKVAGGCEISPESDPIDWGRFS